MSPTNTANNAHREVKFGLTTKLFLLVLVSFGVLMAVINFQVGVEAEKVANTTIEKSLNQSNRILSTRLESRFKDIREKAGNLARDGRLMPLVYAEEAASLQDQCGEFEQSLDFDVLIFTNDEGVVLAKSDDASAHGVFVGDSPLFQTALSGEPSKGIMRSKSDLLQIVAVPVVDNVAPDIVRGTVALAYKLSMEEAVEIKKLTGSEISFFSFIPNKKGDPVEPPKEIYNTFENNRSLLQEYFKTEPRLWQQVLNNQEVTESRINMGGETFHVLFRPLKNSSGDPMGFVTALRSRTELLRPFAIIKNRVMIISIVCLLVASVISYAISRHISKPIIGLVDVTELIQDGHYPDPKPNKRRDEVGILYDAIYRMGQELKEKAELENYLAGMSEGLDDIDPTVTADATSDMSTTSVGDDMPTMATDMDLVVTENDMTLDAKKKFKIGSHVDKRYQLELSLGAGAMGMVFLARDVELNEPVALKVILNPGLKGPYLDQLKQEIRLARRITHKNILRTHDFGMHEGYYYITMEYVQGYDLNRLIKKKGPLDMKMGLLLARQMCSAIGAAHSEGIIHRDLKPQNTMINRGGILKIMDFGLAVQNEQLDTGASESDAPEGFAKNAMIGTPNFMSPEQFSNVEVDLRADIYSLGVILFYMFTGQLPFKAETLWQLAQMHIKEPPPKLKTVRPDAPEALEALIEKALAKKRDDRFQTVNDLANALARVQS
jgi:eukaryotic-like serine/threonine-protein kinase